MTSVSAQTKTAATKTETRLIAMGSAALMDGFALINFETWPDATEKDVEAVLGEIINSNACALVLLEPHLVRADGERLNKLRNEGGRIIITEIPALHAPNDYHPEVEDLILSVLGEAALQSES